jgi:hypothetical protein
VLEQRFSLRRGGQGSEQLEAETVPPSTRSIWGGPFRTFVKGAYYSEPLIEAKSRIDFVPLDPLMQVRAYST